MHSDMDSFILYNDEICPKTEESRQGTNINEEFIAQNLEIVEIIDAIDT